MFTSSSRCSTKWPRGGLSPGDIASPLRWVVRRRRNVRVLLAEAVGVDVARKRVRLRDGELPFDSLVIAAGARNHYFGNDNWAEFAPSLKTLEDAIEIRRRVLLAFERAERSEDQGQRQAWLTFAVVGTGPTGVELAGALAELARDTLRQDFRAIDPRLSRIVLLEGLDRVLPPFPESLSRKCRLQLERMDVEVRLNAKVTDIDWRGVEFNAGDGSVRLQTRTVIWAAGVRGAALGSIVADATDCRLDRQGRVIVQPDLTVPGHPDLFVIGDLAHVACDGDQTLPGIAPVDIQQGRYVAKSIVGKLRGQAPPRFRYRDKGQLATIGRAAAVADTADDFASPATRLGCFGSSYTCCTWWSSRTGFWSLSNGLGIISPGTVARG